jgi:DNA-binding transcriptional LysR family regulator
MKFKLRHMEVFRAVMLTGSTNGAAQLLFVSQPAVSRLLAYTEQSLGLKLFEREKGKLIPTAEARLLFLEVDSLYERAVQVDDFARHLTTQPQGVLSVCTSPSLALNFIPPVVAQLREAWPQVRLKYRTTLIADMPNELLGRKVEVAISVLPLEHPNLVIEPLVAGRMVCIVPEGHALAQVGDSVGLAQIAQHPLILYSRHIPFGQLVAGALQRAGVAWDSAVDIERAENACALVRAGVGVGIVDEFSVGGAGWPGLRVLRIQEDIPLTLSIVRSRFEQSSRLALEFIRLLKAHAKHNAVASSGRLAMSAK